MQPDEPGHTALLQHPFEAALAAAATRYKNKDVARYRELALHLLQAQVCPRCILRLLGHTGYEDYCMEVPPAADLAAALRARQAQHEGQQVAAGQQPCAGGQAVPDGQAAEDAGAADQEPAAKRRAVTAAAAAAAAAAPLEAEAAAPPAGMEEGAGTSGRAATEGQQQDGLPALQQACPMCLGVLQLLDGSLQAGSACTQPLTVALQQQQQQQQQQGSMELAGDEDEACAPCPAGPGAPALAGPPPRARPPQPLQHATPAAVAQALAATHTTGFSTFGLEVLPPAATAIRERMLHAHVAARFGRAGVMSPSHPDSIVLLRNVASRMLAGPLAKLLGKQYVESQACDVTVSLVFSHAGSHAELCALAEDQARMKERKGQKGGWKQQQQQQQQQQGQAGPAGSAGTGVGGNVQAPAGGVPTHVEAAARALTPDSVAAQLSGMPGHVLSRLFAWPPAGPTAASSAGLRVCAAPLLLAGRYLKLERNMPQTRWFDMATGVRIGSVSLAERLEPYILSAYGAEATKFISGGREDADVRMLGSGRPFVLEVINPSKGHPSGEELRGIEAALTAANNGVQVRQLTPCSKRSLERLKEAEETKEKTYQALCWCDRPLAREDVQTLLAVRGLDVMQDTPIRVLHRRASKVRPKRVTVEAVECLEGRPHYFNMRLRTQAGTYVKEFCHGDLGRSHPSLATLLGAGRVEILQLDVLEVHMEEWPVQQG